jgi:hypothetical protein
MPCGRASRRRVPGFGNSPFFEGEVEPCINGRVVALGAYFGERSDRLVARLLSEQLTDGGWNCEAERGSVRSSFHTTICVLEGLLAFEKTFGAAPTVTDARGRFTRKWRAPSASRIAGSRCAPGECWIGMSPGGIPEQPFQARDDLRLHRGEKQRQCTSGIRDANST